ncbi:hypothetical protein HYH03_001492 [Edaphochlamys debaryana]|uniref:EF-hand domain-containing protein n=1 Tax=Edaphochlamys debaryana TaxID=47281 RepID=A0A836C641_9CHLO|nr:hypothetical protein HYH03_001492 [Edaphochlamys debaryana]|eukprot:KAG2500728.1 hypothetical protein HYH03_001492 [Edaphochlamys debaryana]
MWWPGQHSRTNAPAGPPELQRVAPRPPTKPRPDPESLRRWFSSVDKDCSGRISAPELQASLSDGGMNFSLSTVAAIIRQCDSSGSGTIDLADFEKLHTFLDSVQEEFDGLPKDKEGRARISEVVRHLTAKGYDLEPDVQRVIFSRFDPTRCGSLGLQEYLALTLFLRAATTTFRAFDPQSRGSVTLNFPQFLYAAVNSI